MASVGFPCGSKIKNLPAQRRVRSLGLEGPLEEEMATDSGCLFLPGKLHRQGRLAGHNWWGCKRIGYDSAKKQLPQATWLM